MNRQKPRRRPRRMIRPRRPGKPCGCGKRRFCSEPEAQAAALRVSKHVGPIRVYACPRRKDTWHLTTIRRWRGPR